jgi:hypothetical protein
MMRRFVLVAIALFLFILPVVWADGPLYCDVRGHVKTADGSAAPNDILMTVTIQDTLDRATGSYITQTVYTKSDPLSESGYYFASFTQGHNCNFGEPITIEATSGDLYGKTTSILTENPTKGQYDVVLEKQTSTAGGGNNGAEGSSTPVVTSNAVVSDNLMCEIRGFVRDSKTLLGENGIPVTVILQDTAGKATGESTSVQTETKYNPASGDGYFYIAFGPNADCNVGEPVKIIAQKETQFGETDSFIAYSPAKGQYDVLLKPLSENVTNTVRTNPSTIILTTFGLILLILTVVYLKRRNKFGHY